MTPLYIDIYHDECPCCGACVRIVNNTIARHERGLGYIPYRLYHKFAKSGKPEDSVYNQMKRNLCPASGKSVSGENAE